MSPRIDVPTDEVVDFCHRWKITEFSFFGSVLRDDFSVNSDVDVLVTFAEDSRRNLFDYVHIREELMTLLGRDIDLVQECLIENPYRRQEILRTKEVVYAA